MTSEQATASLRPDQAAVLAAAQFGSDGLLPAIAADADTGAVLMLAWMDAEALRRTLATGEATYWSRSRSEYWVKGATSGHTQAVREVRLDCDADAILLLVEQSGPACHTGERSCFDVGPHALAGPAGSDAGLAESDLGDESRVSRGDSRPNGAEAAEAGGPHPTGAST